MTRTLVLELWGLGDAVIMTTALQALQSPSRKLYVLCKPATQELLAPSYPEVTYIPFTAPWTVFTGKYHFWKWPWSEIVRLVRNLRALRFDETVSVRPDPRDHFLMWLSGARMRFGFPRLGSVCFLTHRVNKVRQMQHRVDDWRDLAAAILKSAQVGSRPWLQKNAYDWSDTAFLSHVTAPIIVVHFGAGQPVRRWPLQYYRRLLGHMRESYRFFLVLIPDNDGYGSELRSIADRFIEYPPLHGLAALLAHAALFIGNDSGPAHIAAAFSVPSVAFFGSAKLEWFAPFGPHNLPISRPCQYRPCWDKCHFDEPFCLTKLMPDDAFVQIRQHIDHLIDNEALSGTLAKASEKNP